MRLHSTVGQPATLDVFEARLVQHLQVALVLACTQAPGSRIIEIQMRPMSEPLA